VTLFPTRRSSDLLFFLLKNLEKVQTSSMVSEHQLTALKKMKKLLILLISSGTKRGTKKGTKRGAKGELKGKQKGQLRGLLKID